MYCTTTTHHPDATTSLTKKQKQKWTIGLQIQVWGHFLTRMLCYAVRGPLFGWVRLTVGRSGRPAVIRCTASCQVRHTPEEQFVQITEPTEWGIEQQLKKKRRKKRASSTTPRARKACMGPSPTNSQSIVSQSIFSLPSANGTDHIRASFVDWTIVPLLFLLFRVCCSFSFPQFPLASLLFNFSWKGKEKKGISTFPAPFVSFPCLFAILFVPHFPLFYKDCCGYSYLVWRGTQCSKAQSSSTWLQLFTLVDSHPPPPPPSFCAMRISSLTIWLCAAFLAGANNVTFNTADLEGFNKTTVLLYDKKLVPGNSNDGYMFAWTLNQGWGGTVQSLILAEANGTAIVTVENDQSSNNSHG